jgi:hypothetical protein
MRFAHAAIDHPLPATLTAATTTTTATAAARFILRFVDLERTTAHVLAVEVLNCSRRIGTRHFHEAEAAWTTGFTIHDQCNRIDRAVLGEQGADRALIGGEGQIAHVNLAHLY